MSGDDFVTKQRYIWRPNALQLLREKACARYARQAVPGVVDGMQIRFPEVEVAMGLRVTARSRRLEGSELLLMLYDDPRHEVALAMGLIALRALQAADVGSTHYPLYGRGYELARGPRVALAELFSSSLLAPSERKEFQGLVADYVVDRPGRRVLVHGDLQATHIIVNLSSRSLGFIDLEAMRVGKAATNFAQLWESYHFAKLALGRRFYQLYAGQCSDLIDDSFDADVKAEIALRCYSHIRVAQRMGNRELESKARDLLRSVLSGASFEEICLRGHSSGNGKSLR